MADNPQTIRLERLETGETWDYIKGKPRKTYLYVCKLGDRELYRDTNAAFAGAVKKGYEAADTGAAKETNPYNALASCRGGATFARAFHKYWNLGYDSYGEGSET